MKNTTTLRQVVDTPVDNAPPGDTKLEQLLAEPASVSTPRKRGKLKPATAEAPAVLFDAQKLFANDPTQQPAYTEETRYDPQAQMLFLSQNPGANWERDLASNQYDYSDDFPCLTGGFKVSDSSTRSSRSYVGVQWHPHLRLQADAYGYEVWQNSLDYYDARPDGLWVIERPWSGEDEDSSAGSSGGSGGGGSGGGKGGGGKRPPKPPSWVQISSTPVMVSGLVKDERDSHFVEFSFYQIDPVNPQWVKVLIGFEQLMDEGTGSVWKDLARRGLMLPNKKSTQKFRQMASDYFAMASGNPTKHMQIGRAKPGWHQVPVEGEMVMVYITAGFTTAPHIRYTGSTGMAWETAGNCDQYLLRMAKMFRDNPVVALTTGFNAAGLMISFFPQLDHNPLWALLGQSSIGKTLAAKTALSMRGNPEVLMKNMDATDNALKSRMRAFNHTGGAIDEIGSAEEKNLREKLANIYQWASGNARGRVRANALTGEFDEKAEADRNYYTLLFTGEEAFVDMSAANAGNKVRLAQVVFNKENPLWHAITDKNDAEAWKGFINTNYGHLYPRLVHLISKNLPRYQKAYEEYSKALNATVQSQQQGRKSNAWALAMAGVTLLADELQTVFDEDAIKEEDEHGEACDGMVPGFTHADVDVVFQHAVRLMALEMDHMPIESEQDKYMTFLEGLVASHKADLYMYEDEDELPKESPRANAKGSYTAHTKNKQGEGLGRVHELCIIVKDFSGMCVGSVDKTRLLDWAKEKKYLVTNKDRPDYKMKLAPDQPRTTVYKFVWTEQITEEFTFDTPKN